MNRQRPLLVGAYVILQADYNLRLHFQCGQSAAAFVYDAVAGEWRTLGGGSLTLAQLQTVVRLMSGLPRQAGMVELPAVIRAMANANPEFWPAILKYAEMAQPDRDRAERDRLYEELKRSFPDCVWEEGTIT